MRLFRHYTDLPAEVRGGAVAIGNFDGVHRGHQAVIDVTAALARSAAAPVGVLTFEPHPLHLFKPELPPSRLTSLRTKAHRLEALGVDALYVVHFDRAFAAKSADQFVQEVLVDGLGVRHVVVGGNFHFGQGRGGTVERLQADGRFGVTVIAPILSPEGVPYSSTGIRGHLREGRPEAAAALLGDWWEIEGRVVPGFQRGRTIGFPTANLALGDSLVPALGVYAVRAGLDQGRDTVWRNGVANLGVRPTVAGTGLLLEVHLFDTDEDLYGRHLRVQLLSFIRAERKFESFDALKAQILADATRARDIVATTPARP